MLFNHKDLWAIFLRGIELIVKLSFILSLPIFFSKEEVGHTHYILSLVMFFSLFVNLGLDKLILKKVSIDENYSKIYLNSFLKKIVFFASIILVFLFSCDYLFSIKIFQSVEIVYLIIISGTSFSITLISCALLRGLGMNTPSQIFLGIFWPTFFLVIIILININNTLIPNFDLINLIFLGIFLLNGISSYLYANFHAKKLTTQISYIDKKDLTVNYKFYFESLISNGILWVPILLINFLYDYEQSGELATNFRLLMSLIGALVVIKFLTEKKISNLFAKNKIKSFRSDFNKYQKIKSILSLLLSFSLISVLLALNIFIESNFIINAYFYVPLILMCISQFFGPNESLLMFSNRENKLLLINILILFFTISIILIIYYLNININLFLIFYSIIILISQIYFFYYSKRFILN